MEKNCINYEIDLCFNLVADDYSLGIGIFTTRNGDVKREVCHVEQRVDVNQRPDGGEDSL